MSKNGDINKFLKNVKKDIKKDFIKKSKSQKFTIDCPNCHSSIEVTSGNNICPNCQKNIKFEIDSPKF